MSLIEQVQNEVTRIREMITTTQTLIPNGRCNFWIYEAVLRSAEKAIREQDTVQLINLLSELKEMN